METPVAKCSNYECNICGLIYNHKSSLSRHKKECKKENEVKNTSEKEIQDMNKNYEEQIKSLQQQMELQKFMYEGRIQDLKEQNKEKIQDLKEQNEERIKDFKQQIIQQQTTINSLIESNRQQPANEIFNPYNQSNNNFIQLPTKQPFSLEKYLNTECKDAVNIETFVNNFEVTIDDIKTIKDKKFEDVVLKVLIRNANKYTETTRPFHVSNLREKVIWIKTKGKWEKNTNVFIMNVKNNIFQLFAQLKNRLYCEKLLPEDISSNITPKLMGFDTNEATKVFNGFLKNILVEKS